MNSLLSIYGEYIIEPDTVLFRKAPNRQVYDSMFFGFCTIGPLTSNTKSDIVQVWKTSKPVRSLLMLRGQRLTGEEPFLYSAIVDIYNEYFPLDPRHEYDDVMLKKHDTVYRRRIIKLMKEQGISSWVCSIEDKFAMELFLFAGADDHQEMISYVECYKDLPGYPLKEYPNSFNYEMIKHLPEMKKGPVPHDPYLDWLMSEIKN